MQANEQQTGLYARHVDANIGLISSHVTGRLNGLVAQIKVRQVYKNWSDVNIECVYTFPLGWQSVLLGMRVELNGKSLTGTVKPKKIAESQYEEAIDSGDLPVMLERSGKDLYTANIGNIQNGDEVVIELDYAQILKANEGAIRFSLPTTIAPRYGDAADASLRPHQQTAADPQALHRLFVSLTLSESLSVGTIYSPTHEIQHTREDKESTVKLIGLASLDRDFVLVVDRIGDMNFAVAAKDPVRPGEATVLTGGVYRPQMAKQGQPALIKVLVDCSGSMQGDSISQARDCLNWLIGQLNNNDKVSFTRFGSSVEHDHQVLKHCTAAYKQLLKLTARRLNADLGGTEIDNALKEVIAIEGTQPEESQNAVILLITDGEIWNIEETIATVRASGHRIYAVGVGSSPAESLLKDMAEVTGGGCEMVTPRESMQKAIERLLHRIRQTQVIAHKVNCAAPTLWQSKVQNHATQGEALMAWTQIQTEGVALESMNAVQTIHPNDTPITCPVSWDNNLDLSRIAAALRLHDLSRAEEREALALEYQLVTSETNLILVQERAQSEKPDELPELHQVRPMLAAGYGGNGTMALKKPSPNFRFGIDRSSFSCASIDFSVQQSSTPAVWRSRRSAPIDSLSRIGMDDIEIPAFLRKDSDNDDTSKPCTHISTTETPKDLTKITDKKEKFQATSDELAGLLKNPLVQSNPITKLLHDFNQAALSHNQFNSALAVCLRTNHPEYLQWLVINHMKAAGSAAPIWAVFMIWASVKFCFQLDRHAERLLRDALKVVKPEIQSAVQAELDIL
jgi:Ca-activated chloride channel family protein